MSNQNDGIVEQMAKAIQDAHNDGNGSRWGYDCAFDDAIALNAAHAALSVLPPSDAERKLAAVRELRDATAALCKPPAPTDDDPMSQGAWAARWEVVNALNALLDGEVES